MITQLKKIFPVSLEFTQAMQIYNQSFPENQKQLQSVIESRLLSNICSLYVAIENSLVIGIAIIWDFENTRFAFLDYFAIHPDYRGKGNGSVCMQLIRDEILKLNKSLIFEVEDPFYYGQSIDMIRRIRFYQNIGAKCMANTPYILPSLDGTITTNIIMMIFTNEKIDRIDGKIVKRLFKILYKNVYGRNETDLLLDSFINKVGDKVFLKKYFI